MRIVKRSIILAFFIASFGLVGLMFGSTTTIHDPFNLATPTRSLIPCAHVTLIQKAATPRPVFVQQIDERCPSSQEEGHQHPTHK